jgi:hypothetical protein
MTEREEPESDEEPEKRRPLPPRPGSRDSEKALGLEVAKLFGLSPRDLVARPSPPADRPKTQPDGGEASGGDEDPEPVQDDS